MYYRKHIHVYIAIAVVAAWCSITAYSEALPHRNIEKLDPNMAVVDPDGEWLWYDAKWLEVEGKGWTETESFFHRLPAKARGVVRDPVWALSQHSAGICIRFSTNATKIAAKWEVDGDALAMPHMPATGVSGLDLYVNDQGVWRWLGNGRPAKKTTQAVLAAGIPEGAHEYMLYLPLYNGTKSLEIGVPPNAVVSPPSVRPQNRNKPLVFYGTSITHGGCASRPGMAYPSILGRRLEYSIINLGFSGNGTLDSEMGVLLGELDSAAYIIDCIPNMSVEMITERVVPFITALHESRPDTPIVLVESIYYQSGAFLPEVREANREKNKALRDAYDRLAAQNMANLHYLSGDSLMGDDGEATVDGVHPTDLGFMRMADAIEPTLHTLLLK